MAERPDTHQKALQINLDPSKYGVFAEIGAGQEVARWFFRVGGAAGTIAKSISAYDMTVSDAIYGPSDRYVGKNRLISMLSHEHKLLVERLAAQRGTSTRFFVFADTVTAKSFVRRDETHGWMGIRFQAEPGGPPNDILMHVRMADRENFQQAEALGILGVNLIHAALYDTPNVHRIVEALLDQLSIERIEVDVIDFEGPAFQGVDNRLVSLQLVERGLTNAAMFTPDGKIVQPAELIYTRPVLIQRGSFRPPTKVSVDMIRYAQAQFVQEPDVEGKDVRVVLEMTLKNLNVEGKINHRDFLDRADLLATLGHPVMISNYGEFFRLASYFFRYTKMPIGIVMGVPTLRELFDEKYYAELDGGILESFGYINNIDGGVVPAKTGFDSDGFLCAFYDGGGQFNHFRDIPEKSGAGHTACYLGNRATEVDINYIGIFGLDHFGSLDHIFYLTAEVLDTDGSFVVENFEFFQ
jgi:hypothetical protein